MNETNIGITPKDTTEELAEIIARVQKNLEAERKKTAESIATKKRKSEKLKQENAKG